MKACGIIAEFNPFHDGHRYLLQQVRQKEPDAVIIVVLSTWFTSRGIPSVQTPEYKTKLALEAGADLVIALPCVYAMQSADYFARYALESLAAAGISKLYFGSETADLLHLEQTLDQLLAKKVDPTTSQARSAANVVSLRPNDLLAIQYIRHARPLGIECIPLLRDQTLHSATWLRHTFFEGKLPKNMAAGYDRRQCWPTYYPWLRYALLMEEPQVLATRLLVSEGIEHRLITKAREHDRWKDFLAASISKTYSKARIQRTGMMILMQIDQKEMKEHDSFDAIMLLGLNERGSAWLRQLPEDTPVYSRLKELPQYLKKIERQAIALYNLAAAKPATWRIVREQKN